MSADGILSYLANQTKYYQDQFADEQQKRAVENAIRIQKVQADFARGQEALQNSVVREKALRDESGAYSEAKLREQQTGEIAPTGNDYSDARLRDQLGLPPMGQKPSKPLENFLGGVDSQESYRTSMMQYLASGGRKPKWYTGNYEADKGNIDAAIGATMTPLQQMQRAEAAQRNQDLEEARLARIQLAKDVEARRSREAALKREGMAPKKIVPDKNERIQADTALASLLGEEAYNAMSHYSRMAVADKAASLAKTQMGTEEAKGVDYTSLLQDAYNELIASGELKLPQEGTGLRGFLGFGQEAKPAGFSPKGSTPQDQVPQSPSAPSAPAKVQSRADYDALPVGALYVHPNGKTYRKK